MTERQDGSLDSSEAAYGELVDVLLGATPVLVQVAAHSAEEAGAITLAQYRVLARLSAAGPHRVADLADALSVSSPNATRICARLARKHLVRRSRSSVDRRSVRVSLTPQGRSVVDVVGARRRVQFGRIIESMSAGGRTQLDAAMREFMTVAGDLLKEEGESPS